MIAPTERGRLIGKELLSYYKSNRRTNLIGGFSSASAIFIGFCVFIILFPYAMIEPPFIPLAIFIFLFCILYIASYRLGISRALRRQRLTFYEKGMTPYRKPYGLKLPKGEEYYRPWEDVIFMWFSGEMHTPFKQIPCWFCDIVFKDYTVVGLLSLKLEENDREAILTKLKHVHEEVKKRGEVPEQEIREKVNPWNKDIGWY